MNEQARIMTQTPDGKWSPGIPEPFWFRRWFRWKPGCWECSMGMGREVRFRDRSAYELHYRDEHLIPRLGPCNAADGGYFCAKPQGHAGLHESCGGHGW